ncbi:CocE/NonD family hydrolase [Nocardia alni]|uniref:CocE/NonD family hydrolase n=1 Tax=Nocardia alni TaxID=2815723 RepID=UPI001C232609|nr:CocE/NonD family hydrolase [Nocardia alni]
MTDTDQVFVPATTYDLAKAEGRFARFDPGQRTLPAGWRYNEDYGPLAVDITFDKDVAVELRDGTTIYVDVFRPAGATDIPVIVAWSPYGKDRGTSQAMTQLRKQLGIDTQQLSGLMKFEAPDPGFWCARGYAVCNPDARGATNSEGDIQFFGTQEGRDAADLVEWLAAQAWCNGRVGMNGNSYLAVSQWFTAAEQPAHLAAIAPWEGFSDIYRDILCRGGIPDTTVSENLKSLNFIGRNRMEDASAEIERYPLMNDLWRSKIPALDRITVPAYVVASYSNTFHTEGTFRAWEHIASEHKWLRIHDRMEWPDLYRPENQLDLKAFFDHFLKGIDNDWPATPRVRYSLLDLVEDNLTGLPATSFPPPGVRDTWYHLDADSRAVAPAPTEAPGVVRYDGTDENGRAEFTLTVTEQTQLAGHPVARLWVEAENADDMDLFLLLQKLDGDGQPLTCLNVDSTNPALQEVTRHGASILRYRGATGLQRVSLRHLDQNSDGAVPRHTFDRVEKLTAGQIVPVEIVLQPIGLILRPGESLRLVVSGTNLVGGPQPGMAATELDNHGTHVIHTGGQYDSALRLPVLAGGR